MKLLHEYIRVLLLEFEAGKKLWPDHAPVGSRHSGDEPDTGEEEALRNFILQHVDTDSYSLSSGAMEMLLHAASDPRYNDVIKRYSGPVYRGIAVGPDWMDNNLPPNWKKKGLEEGQLIRVNFDYVPEGIEIDSWTKDPEIATDFAITRQYRDYEGQAPYAIVLRGVAAGQSWIDLQEIIQQYAGAFQGDYYGEEAEVITNLQSVPIIEIQVVKIREYK